MKKLILFIWCILSVGIGYTQDFTVDEFTAEIFISSKGYFDVVENYKLNFHEQKHGITRDIDTQYDFEDEEGNVSERTIYISKLKVPKHKFTTSSNWGGQPQRTLQIRIGDANKVVSGEQEYQIKYRVKNAFISTDSLVQFYWNIKPPKWRTNFKSVTFTIHAPDGAVLNDDNSFVYSGSIGASDPSEEFEYTYEGNVLVAKSKEGFESAYGESVTALIKMPESLIPNPAYSPPWWKVNGWIALLPLLIAFFGRLWYKYGKEDRVITTTSYYPPKGVDPPMANYLLNNKADNKGLIALIPEWGSKGLLRVEEVDLNLFGKVKENSNSNEKAQMEDKDTSGWLKKGMNFIKDKVTKTDIRLLYKKPLPEDSTVYEHRIFKGLFGTYGKTVMISDLKNKFYKTMETARKDLKTEAKVFYDKKSLRIGQYAFLGSIVLTIGLPILFFKFWGFVAALAVGLLGFICIFLSSRIQKKNEGGRQALSELKGFKEFIRVAEIDRIKMLIEEDPDYFEKTMSYAVAFGMLGKWAKKFDALNIEPPDWYTSHIVGVTSMNSFANSFTQNINKAQTSMVSAPKSTSSSSGGGSRGGGSAGGGFGGGGGGSW